VALDLTPGMGRSGASSSGIADIRHNVTSFFLLSQGCKVNQCEAEAIGQAWEGLGLRRVDDPGLADVVLLSLCAVTVRAVRDGRQAVRRLGRDHPGCRLIVSGCAAEVFPEEFRELPGVVRVAGQKRKAVLAWGPEAGDDGRPLPGWPPLHGYHRARPVLRIQDGCSHGCSYCIVPRTRGPSRSRPPEEVLAEARRLLKAGFRELVVSGINLAHYGRDLEGVGFWELMAFLERGLAPEWAGRARLRLSSLEPGQLDQEAWDYFAGSRLVCPHLHLSLQSGSPGVLERMRRGHYHPEQAAAFCRELQGVWPVFGLGADLLAGFPGETEREFRETLDLVQRLPLSYAHVFPFSPRPGTAAAGMADRVPVAEAKARAEVLRGEGEAKREAFLRRCLELGQVTVLVQDEAGFGVSEHYAGCRIAAGAEAFSPRSLVRARPAGLEGGRLLVVASGQDRA
jgi:MiaB/RimO family radical SAM methylthiotransferase